MTTGAAVKSVEMQTLSAKWVDQPVEFGSQPLRQLDAEHDVVRAWQLV
ncbi:MULTISPECIES: hypothetical protein [unclassified Endozoicomonas]|nr:MULTISPECIES: hypothetical protein [unclassified Endozoicomonas]